MEDKDAVISSLRRRVAELEQENQRLTEQLARSREMSLRPPSAARLRSALSSSGGAGIASAAAISRERSNSLEASSAVLADGARQTNAENVCDNWCVVSWWFFFNLDVCCHTVMPAVPPSRLYAIAFPRRLPSLPLRSEWRRLCQECISRMASVWHTNA